MPISPLNPFPEKGTPVFERKGAPSVPGNKGPLRFEEGVATDTDIPNDFARGAYGDTAPVGNRPNSAITNREHMYKHADETMRERAHIGSASWVEAPEVLGDFVQGAGSGQRDRAEWERAYNSGGYQARRNKTVVSG